METDGDAKHVLVVEEKELCVPQFVSENDLEKIWSENDTVKQQGDNKKQVHISEHKDKEYYITPNEYRTKSSKKATENPLFRRKIKVNENIGFTKDDSSYTSETEYTDIDDNDYVEYEENETKMKEREEHKTEIDETEIIKMAMFEDTECDNHVEEIEINNKKCTTLGKFISSYWSAIILKIFHAISIIVLCVSNKWTWNVITIVTRILIAIFIYLVLACSTVIIAILLSTYDAYVKGNIEDETTNDGNYPLINQAEPIRSINNADAVE